MRILIVAATQPEVEPLMEALGMHGDEDEPNLFNTRHASIANCSVLITGAGMVPTAFALARHLPHNVYNLVINLGIAGSFDRNIALGELAEITEDTFAELGAEDDNNFISIEKLGFGASIFKPTSSISQFTKKVNLKQAKAITVNTVHGNDDSISSIVDRLNPQLESMEGAAFFYACRELKVPCIQIRAVSNYVEKRNRDNWQIGLAVKNLNTFALDLLKEL
ncbi:MAG TPA: futalosine hydrolase [Mucilaginibacter sp.]|jgi:futalosine hydrolase|nr:futalosine hydrolase [Mucilaginibacter sp.]